MRFPSIQLRAAKRLELRRAIAKSELGVCPYASVLARMTPSAETGRRRIAGSCYKEWQRGAAPTLADTAVVVDMANSPSFDDQVYGAKVSERTLVPGAKARLGATKLDWWLTHVPPPTKS